MGPFPRLIQLAELPQHFVCFKLGADAAGLYQRVLLHMAVVAAHIVAPGHRAFFRGARDGSADHYIHIQFTFYICLI